MVDIAIDAVLVDVLREQLGDDKEYLRARGGKGKAASIGHHAAVDGDGEMLTLILEMSELPHDAEDDFTGAADLGVGNGELGWHIRVEVMVEEHDDTRRPEQGGLHLVDTARRIEVEAEHEIGNLQMQIAAFAVFVVADDFFCVGQPVEEVGKLIGHNDCRLLAHSA